MEGEFTHLALGFTHHGGFLGRRSGRRSSPCRHPQSRAAAPPPPCPGCGCATCRGGPEGIYRASVDAREPQNPTESEEYRRYLQPAVGVQREFGGGSEGGQRGSIGQV
eukprot:7101109-Pyramimonas_sp.AAC.1